MVICRRSLIRQRTNKYCMILGRCGPLKVFTVAAILLCYAITIYVIIKLTTSFSGILLQNANNTRQSEILRPLGKDSKSKGVINKNNNTLKKNITQVLETENKILESFTRKLKSQILSSMLQIVHNNGESISSQDKNCFYSGLKDVLKRSTLSDDLILKNGNNLDAMDHLQHQERDNYYSNAKQKIIYQIIQNKNDADKIADKSVYSVKCNRFVTISAAMGRTGNQLFQVAAVIGTAYRYNLIPVLPENFPLLRHFNLPIKKIKQPLNNTVLFAAEKPGVYKDDIKHLNFTRNLTLDGFFQSWKYFSETADIVRNIILPKTKYLNESRAFLKSVYKPGRVNVCVHVRRGDMLRQTAKNEGYKIADNSFFPNAMNYYRNRFKDVLFIIISDGMFWCKQHLIGEDIVYSPFYDSATDMALMTSCEHVIVTSGTFGWWGAWLTRGITVYYSGYPATGSKLDRNMNRQDYYPREWIGIP